MHSWLHCLKKKKDEIQTKNSFSFHAGLNFDHLRGRAYFFPLKKKAFYDLSIQVGCESAKLAHPFDREWLTLIEFKQHNNFR